MSSDSNRFLLISPDFPPPLVGGSLVYLYNLIGNCPENFDVLTSPKSNDYDEVFNYPNRVFRSRFIKDSHDPTKFELLITYLYMPIWLIFMNFKMSYSAVLVNPGLIGNSLLFVVGKIFRIKVIGIGHGEEITVALYGKGIKNYIKRFIMSLCYKRADGFVVVCHFCRRLLISLGVDGETIDVIPSCLNPEKINKNQKSVKNHTSIISVGRLIERKGFHFLVEAVTKLKDKYPAIHLEIVGDGPYRKNIEEKINETNSSAFINLNGEISDEKLISLYQKSSLFVLAHTLLENGDTEGCPTVFSEAMAHGLPVIGGLGAGADTAIIHGKNGYIVDTKNIDSLASAIDKVLSDGDLAESMKKFGKKKLEKDHDPIKNGVALQKTLYRIMEGRRASGYQKEFNNRPELPDTQ